MVWKVSSVCNEVFFVNAGMGNTPLLEYGIVHAGIYWQIRDLPKVSSMPALLVS